MKIVKTVMASDIKIGDRIIDPNIIKPYLTKNGLLSDELAEVFSPVLKVGFLKDVDIDKRNEILKNFCFSLDTIIIMVEVTGEPPKILKQFIPNGTMNLFHSPSDKIMVLDEEYCEEDDDESDDWDDPNTYANCSDWEDEPGNCYSCADDECPMNKS